MRKRIRRILRRLIIWAVGDPLGALTIRADVNIPCRNAEEIFIRGASTNAGRKAIVNIIKMGQTNREL